MWIRQQTRPTADQKFSLHDKVVDERTAIVSCADADRQQTPSARNSFATEKYSESNVSFYTSIAIARQNHHQREETIVNTYERVRA